MFNDDSMLFLQSFLQAPVAIAIVSLDGRCVRANKMFTDWIGYEEVELGSRCFYDLTHAPDAELEREALEQLQNGRQSSFRIEKRWIHKRGHLILAKQTISIVKKDDLPVCFTYYIQEAEQVLPESRHPLHMLEELRQGQKQLRRVLEIANTGTSIVDLSGRIVRTDAVLQRMLGYSEQELKNITFYELTHPDDVESNAVLYKELLEGKRDHYRLEKRYIRKDGKVVWGALTVCMLHQDPPLITTMIQDITKRKKLEFGLQESETRFRMIAEHVRDMICIRDRNGIYTYISPASAHSLGYSEQQLLDRSTLEFIHPDDRLSYKRNFERLLQLNHMTISYRFRNKSGKYIWLESKMQVFQDADRTIQIVTISRDITKYKERERELKATQRLWKELSILDGVTEIFNRRHFEETLKREWGRCEKKGRSLSLLLLDIDYFKEYNDTYGHQKGDLCLKQVAQTIKASLHRSMDTVFRYGGEEFAVILPETDTYGAKYVAERIRDAVEQAQISHQKSKISDRITISIGCATRKPTVQSKPEQLVVNADEALYHSKHRGRNKVTVCFNE